MEAGSDLKTAELLEGLAALPKQGSLCLFCNCLPLVLVSVTLRRQRSYSVYPFALSATITEHPLCEQVCATHGGDICICVRVCICTYVNILYIHSLYIYYVCIW